MIGVRVPTTNSSDTCRSARLAARGSTSVRRGGWSGSVVVAAHDGTVDVAVVGGAMAVPSAGTGACPGWWSLMTPSPRSTPPPTRTAPRPTIHRNRPSLTGPIRPSAMPPGLGSARSSSMYLMMSRFWSGRERVVAEHRHVLRAGEHGLPDLLRGGLRQPARTCRCSAHRPRRRSCGTGRSWSGTARRRAAGRPGGVEVLGRRDRRAGRQRGDVGGERVDLGPGCRSAPCASPGRRVRRAASGRCPTWKSTAAAPTPIRLGPVIEVARLASLTMPPCALRPWQLEQPSRNSWRPLAICDGSPSLLDAVAVPAALIIAYRPPVNVRPTTSSRNVATGWRRRSASRVRRTSWRSEVTGRPLTGSGRWSRTGRSTRRRRSASSTTRRSRVVAWLWVNRLAT